MSGSTLLQSTAKIVAVMFLSMVWAGVSSRLLTVKHGLGGLLQKMLMLVSPGCAYESQSAA